MNDSETKIELRNAEDKLRAKYSLLSKLFIIIAIVFSIIVAIVFLGINSLGYGYNWAGLGLDTWVMALCILLGIFIILELLFFFHFSSAESKRRDAEKPKKEFINGKRVYVFTHPEGKEGGIFSKTYIDVDDTIVVRIRALMIPPEELWSKKE